MNYVQLEAPASLSPFSVLLLSILVFSMGLFILLFLGMVLASILDNPHDAGASSEDTNEDSEYADTFLVLAIPALVGILIIMGISGVQILQYHGKEATYEAIVERNVSRFEKAYGIKWDNVTNADVLKEAVSHAVQDDHQFKDLSKDGKVIDYTLTIDSKNRMILEQTDTHNVVKPHKVG